MKMNNQTNLAVIYHNPWYLVGRSDLYRLLCNLQRSYNYKKTVIFMIYEDKRTGFKFNNEFIFSDFSVEKDKITISDLEDGEYIIPIRNIVKVTGNEEDELEYFEIQTTDAIIGFGFLFFE